MVSKMVDENSPKWNKAEDVVRDVKIAKEYIESLLVKYPTWEDWIEKVDTNAHLFENKAEYGQVTGKQGLGRRTIKKLCKTLDEHKIDTTIKKPRFLDRAIYRKTALLFTFK